jgi:hypothetical protein
MKQERIDEVLSMFTAEAHSRPSPMEYEMAYGAHVARLRIRSAIREIELAVNQSDQVREATVQLLDALDRLDAFDRRFQERSRKRRTRRSGELKRMMLAAQEDGSVLHAPPRQVMGREQE